MKRRKFENAFTLTTDSISSEKISAIYNDVKNGTLTRYELYKKYSGCEKYIDKLLERMWN